MAGRAGFIGAFFPRSKSTFQPSVSAENLFLYSIFLLEVYRFYLFVSNFYFKKKKDTKNGLWRDGRCLFLIFNFIGIKSTGQPASLETINIASTIGNDDDNVNGAI